jgi:DNA (cytosine-5)-methyltransferase 1
MTLRVFEAFAGYGSQAIALKRLARFYPPLKLEFVGISEIDKNAVIAYKAIHGDIRNYGDISAIDWNEVPDFDLFTYSFPCQDISNAGLQRGFTEGSGTRSSLLWECKKAIEAKHPKYLLMENVKALTQKKFMPYFKMWADCLEGYGYKNFWKVLNSKHYGVPQNRERVFMVSIRDDGDNPSYTFPEPFPLQKRLKDILEKEVDESFYLRQEQVQRIVAHCERKVAEGCGFKTNFTDGSSVSGTIKTKEGTREYDTYVKEGLNTEDDGTSRTIKSQYYKTSGANFERSASYGATGVVESTPPKYGNSRLNKMIEDGKINPGKTEWVDAYNQITNDEISGTILTRVDASNHYLINEGGG